MSEHPLAPALSGEQFWLEGPVGRLACYRAGPEGGTAAPVVVVHTVNAAASAYEVRPVYERLSASRPVYALDLPGFGRSERPDVTYSPRIFTDAVRALVAEVGRRHGAAPLDAVGVSLGSEFIARAVFEAPERFGHLALVSPTGFAGRARLYGASGSTREVGLLSAVLRGRPYSAPAFRALTHPRVVRYFLERTFGQRNIDEDMWRYAVATAREKGAHFAPLSFLTGALFSADINAIYEALALPVWVGHGVRGDFTDYRGLSSVRGKPNWTIAVFQTGALPYFEPGPSAEFFAELEGFLARPAAG